jgi:hypothetical protein
MDKEAGLGQRGWRTTEMAGTGRQATTAPHWLAASLAAR